MMSRFPGMTAARLREALLYPEPALSRLIENLKALGLE
jgi:hypothetical protein